MCTCTNANALGPESFIENIFAVPNFSQNDKWKENMQNGYW